MNISVNLQGTKPFDSRFGSAKCCISGICGQTSQKHYSTKKNHTEKNVRLKTKRTLLGCEESPRLREEEEEEQNVSIERERF